MRAKIVLPVVIVGLLLAGAAWWLRPGRVPSAPPPTLTAVTAPTGAASSRQATPDSPQPGAAATAAAHPAPEATAPGMESSQQREQDYVQERVAQLLDLAMDDQPSSLQIILGELNNRDPDIRQAAVQAAMQFGSRDAIPRLRDAIDQTDDVREKAALQDAIEFLQLPSPNEVAAARAASGVPVSSPAAPRRP